MPTHGAQQRASETTCTATRHGTRAAYMDGCRCTDARRAHARYQKQWNYDRDHQRPRRVPSVGAQRRLHALMAMGWDLGTLARHIGRRQLNISHRRVISTVLHRRICCMFDELATRRGPSAQAAAYADRQGWLPPLAWDDDTIDDPEFTNGFHVRENKDNGYATNVRPEEEFYKDIPDRGKTDVDHVVIDRYLAGDRTIRLNRAEKQEVFHTLRARGHTLSAACTQLRLSGSTGRRYEAARTGLAVGSDVHAAGNDDLEETG